MSDDDEEVILPRNKKKFRVEIVYDCYICYEETKDIVRFGCGHKMCEGCLGNLRKLACPFCRRELTHNDIGMKTLLTIQHRTRLDQEDFAEERFQDFLRREASGNHPQYENLLENNNDFISLFRIMFGIPIEDL